MPEEGYRQGRIVNKNSGDRRVAVECEVALHHPVATLVATRDAQEMWTLAWVNRGAAAFFGLPAGQMTGGDLLTRVGLHAVLEHAHAKAASRYRTTLLLSGTHESSWMDVTCAAMEGGGPARYLVTFTPTLIEAAHHSPTREAQLHAGLQLAVQTSELLTLGDSQNVVRLIAELVARTCGHRTGFFTLRHHDGLQEISGMISDREDIAEVDHERAARDPLTHWWQTTGGARTFRVPAPVPSTGAFARLITQLQARPGDRITVIAARTHTSMPLLLAATPAGEGSWSHAAMGELLEPTCRRVATALETFEYRSRNQVLIEALQRSMLPAHGEVGDLDVWSYYLPHSRVAHVGGDWFDIRAADRDTTQVILGDAVGHDVESIATMNQIRAVLASLSGTRMRPNRLISRADTAVQGLRIANTAALSVTEFSRTRLGQWQIHYALAGHLPGVRITRGGALPLISSASGLLGYPTATRVTHRVTLHPGDAIVLFTDGLIERRGIDLQTAMANLCRFLGTIATPDAASIGEALLQLAEGSEDDLSLVVVRIPGGDTAGPGPRGRRWQLRADGSSPATARQLTRRVLAQWNIAAVDLILVVVSELVSNAVIHGLGRITLRLQQRDDALRIEVEDANPIPPTMRTDALGASEPGGFGLQLVDELAEWGWRPSAVGKVVWALIPLADGDQR